MKLSEMNQQVDVQLGRRIPFGEFFSAFLRVIKRINIEGEKPTMIVALTGAEDWGYTIDTDNRFTIDADERIIGAGRWVDGVTWDDINQCITIPAQYKLRHLFADGERMRHVPYDLLKTGTLNDKCYTAVNRNIYFAGDMNKAKYQLMMRVRVDYAMPSRADEDYTVLPDSAEALVYAGIFNVLYSQPKYADERQQILYARQFNDLLVEWNMQVLRREPRDHQPSEYNWEVN